MPARGCRYGGVLPPQPAGVSAVRRGALEGALEGPGGRWVELLILFSRGGRQIETLQRMAALSVVG